MSLRNKSKVSKNSDLTREIQDAASKIWIKNNINNLSVSLSHSREFAIAVVVGTIDNQK